MEISRKNFNVPVHVASILSTFSEWKWSRNARLRARRCWEGQRILLESYKNKKLKGRILFINYMVLRYTGHRTDQDTCRIQAVKHRKFGHLKYWEDGNKQRPCSTLFCFNALCQFTPLLNFRLLIFGLLPFGCFICVFYLRFSHLRPFLWGSNLGLLTVTWYRTFINLTEIALYYEDGGNSFLRNGDTGLSNCKSLYYCDINLLEAWVGLPVVEADGTSQLRSSNSVYCSEKKWSYVSDLLVHRTFFSSSAPWSAALLAFHLNISPYWSPLSSARAIPVKGSCWFISVAYIYSSHLIMNTACKNTTEIAWGCFETYKLSQRCFNPS